MSDPIHLTVIGIPAPQGSKTRMPNGAMVDGASTTGRAKLAEWRRAVADTARQWLTDHPDQGTLTGPVGLIITFRFPATKSNPHRHWHAVKPDIDKIVRATLDALTSAGMIRDDSLVSTLIVRKRWCRPGELPGADVTVFDLSGEEQEAAAIRKANAKAMRHG